MPCRDSGERRGVGFAPVGQVVGIKKCMLMGLTDASTVVVSCLCLQVMWCTSRMTWEEYYKAKREWLKRNRR